MQLQLFILLITLDIHKCQAVVEFKPLKFDSPGLFTGIRGRFSRAWPLELLECWFPISILLWKKKISGTIPGESVWGVNFTSVYIVNLYTVFFNRIYVYIIDRIMKLRRHSCCCCCCRWLKWLLESLLCRYPCKKRF